jgi:hypothetical protein
MSKAGTIATYRKLLRPENDSLLNFVKRYNVTGLMWDTHQTRNTILVSLHDLLKVLAHCQSLVELQPSTQHFQSDSDKEPTKDPLIAPPPKPNKWVPKNGVSSAFSSLPLGNVTAEKEELPAVACTSLRTLVFATSKRDELNEGA